MRLIDADALNKKLCETTIFIKGGEIFQRMINDAPTIEPDGDLISRRKAIKAVESKWYVYENKHLNDYEQGWNDACEYIEDDILGQLPSAETPTVSEKHQLSEETPTNTPTDLISRKAVLDAINGTFWSGTEKEINNIPSAEVEDRLYIKIYADDEPSVMAEKLYQICGETQNGEVAEWLKEYFPSASDSRQRGEWIEREDWNGDSYYDCSVCGESFVLCDGTPSMNLYHFCPNCGADMRGDKNG